MDQQPSTLPWLDRAVIRGFPIRWEHLLWAVLCVVALGSRFAMLDTRVMSHDESQHTQLAWSLYRGTGYTPNPMTHGPFQILLVAGSYFLFGAGDFSARVPAALFGVAAVMLLYFFRRWLGRAGALAAGALMAISPYMLYYSRYVRNESFVVVWGLLLFYSIGRYLESRQPRWLYLLAAATALHYATKETAYIYAVLAIVFLAGLVQWQLYLHKWTSNDRRRWYLLLSLLAVVLAAGAAALFVAGRADLIQQAKASGVVTPADMMTHTAMLITSPIVQIGVALFILFLAALVAAMVTLLAEFPLPVLRDLFPAVDILVVMGTTLLPQLAAFPMALFNLNPFDGDPFAKLQNAAYLLEFAGVSPDGDHSGGRDRFTMESQIVAGLRRDLLRGLYRSILRRAYQFPRRGCRAGRFGELLDGSAGGSARFPTLVLLYPAANTRLRIFAGLSPAYFPARRLGLAQEKRVDAEGGAFAPDRRTGIGNETPDRLEFHRRLARPVDVCLLERGRSRRFHSGGRKNALADGAHYAADDPAGRLGDRQGD